MWFTPFQNALLCAKWSSNVVLFGWRLRSAAFLGVTLDFRDFITIWHSTIMAYFRSCLLSRKSEQDKMILDFSGDFRTMSVKTNYLTFGMEFQINGCFSTEWLDKQPQRLLWGWTWAFFLPRQVGCRWSNEIPPAPTQHTHTIGHHEEREKKSTHIRHWERNEQTTPHLKAFQYMEFPPHFVAPTQIISGEARSARGPEGKRRISTNTDMEPSQRTTV